MSSKIDCRECMGTGGIERLSNCKHCAGTGKIAAPVVERQPFRFLVKSCYGPISKSIENADESMRDSIESARQYFGVEHELDAEKAKSLVYISPGEWFAIPLYAAPPELAELQAQLDKAERLLRVLRSWQSQAGQESIDAYFGED